jgi:carbon storage regulator CsrA
MLVLGRRFGEGIWIGSGPDAVFIKVESHRGGNSVRLKIDAPRHIRIRREELPDNGKDAVAKPGTDADPSSAVA